MPGSRFARYFVCGCAALGVHLAVMSAAIEGLGLHATLASSLGLACGMAANFLLQRRYTFRSKVPLASGGALFCAFALLTLALNALLFGWLSAYLHYLPAQLVATGLVFVLSFELNRRYTFRPGSGPSAGPPR